MRISFNTRHKHPDTIAGFNGFGTATKGMLASLERLGHRVTINDPSAPVGIQFDQPTTFFKDGPPRVNWEWYGNQYRIGYLPWESTKLHPAWIEQMNQCNEIWTPSPLIAEWFRELVTPPVYVYEHGIDHSWAYRPRERHEPFKFLTVGGETRKKTYDCRVRAGEAFAGEEHKISMTLKAPIYNFSFGDGVDHYGFDGGRYLYTWKRYDLPDLQQMHYDHDAYIYLSAGEGFGLTPLQAMATGMPTVTVSSWAPYADLIDPNLAIKSKLVNVPFEHEHIHPGQWWQYDHEDARRAIRYVYDNYDECLDYAAKIAPVVHERYDWDTITKKVFSDLENRLYSTAS